MNRSSPRVAILVENLYQEMEVWYPIYRLQESGAKVTIIGPQKGKYSSKLGYPVEAELAAEDARPDEFDAVIVPGGFAPDLMRVCKPMVEFVRQMDSQGKLVAAICHGTWLPVSAGILKGRHATGAPSLADDIRNAGGTFVDEAVVQDGNLITSRRPADIPAFGAAILQVLADLRSPAWA